MISLRTNPFHFRTLVSIDFSNLKDRCSYFKEINILPIFVNCLFVQNAFEFLEIAHWIKIQNWGKLCQGRHPHNMATLPWGNCQSTRYNKGKSKEIARTSLGEGIQRSCTMNENPRNLTTPSQRRHCATKENMKKIGPTSIRKAYGRLGHASLHKRCTMNENQTSSSHFVPKEGIWRKFQNF